MHRPATRNRRATPTPPRLLPALRHGARHRHAATRAGSVEIRPLIPAQSRRATGGWSSGESAPAIAGRTIRARQHQGETAPAEQILPPPKRATRSRFPLAATGNTPPTLLPSPVQPPPFSREPVRRLPPPAPNVALVRIPAGR